MQSPADHTRATFAIFAATEADPRAYLASLIPWNFAIVRRAVARKGRGWRKEAHRSLIAVQVARQMLAEMPR